MASGSFTRTFRSKSKPAKCAGSSGLNPGIVYNPVTLRADQTLADAQALVERYNFTGFPVVDAEGRVVGIVTNRDMRFATSDDTPIKAMMTADNLAMLQEPADLEEAKSLMRARRIEKLLVVDTQGKLTGLLTLKDTEQAVLEPNSLQRPAGPSARGCRHLGR